MASCLPLQWKECHESLTLFVLSPQNLGQCLDPLHCGIQVCCLSKGISPSPLGCSPALGGLQFCGHLVLAEFSHGESCQRLVCPGENRAGGDADGLVSFWPSMPKPQGRRNHEISSVYSRTPSGKERWKLYSTVSRLLGLRQLSPEFDFSYL